MLIEVSGKKKDIGTSWLLFNDTLKQQMVDSHGDCLCCVDIKDTNICQFNIYQTYLEGRTPWYLLVCPKDQETKKST